MSELRERLKQEFTNQEYREAYAEGFLNTSIATQMQVIREQRDMSQAELAEKVGTKQAGISRIENVNYSAWKIETLKKIAFALGCRLKVSIETFGSLLDEVEAFSEETLKRVPFEQDPVFNVQATITQAVVVSESPDLYKKVYARVALEKDHLEEANFPVVNLKQEKRESERDSSYSLQV